MPLTGPYRIPANDTERDSLAYILAESFSAPIDKLKEYFGFLGHDNLRILEVGDVIAGGLWFIPMGQFFGGRPVPMYGVAGVGIAPPFRGTGAGHDLMARAMRELNERDVPLSTLYPATQQLYRRSGYEQAGHRLECTLDLASIRIKEPTLEVRQLEEADRPAVAEFYRKLAHPCTGFLDRGDYIWQRVHSVRDEITRGYGVWGPDGLEGYTYFVQRDKTDGLYSLTATDIRFATPAAGRKLLSLYGHHSSMGKQLRWFGSPADPILHLLPEARFSMAFHYYWMTRVCHVEKALLARGYPPNVEAELHLDVRDDVVEANEGRLRLRVSGGEAGIERGGRGDLKVDVRGLAALYAGMRDPLALRAVGALDGPDDALARAGALFAGPTPAMPDMF